MANWTLYQWGLIQFRIWPLSLTGVQHNTATDWSRKDIAGAAVYREWVGENDEEITFTGATFPHFYRRQVDARGNNRDTGVGTLEVLDNMRRLGQAHALTRGDGWHHGWFVIEQLQRGHQWIHIDGVGQQLTFQAKMQRVPIPTDPFAYFPALWGEL